MTARIGVLVAVAALALAGRGPARADDGRTLWIENVHTGETVRLRPFAGGARLEPLTWRRLSRLFRSWRTGRRRTVHPRLVRTLRQIQRHFGGRRIELVSGYRVPEDESAPTSYHGVARAADVRLDGVDKRELFDYCVTLQQHAPLGCGYYPNTTFVHIDVRGRAASWVDRSAAGQPRDYVAHPAAWLRRHR